MVLNLLAGIYLPATLFAFRIRQLKENCKLARD